MLFAIAGTLAVNILAITTGFNRGIAKARKSLTGFNKTARTTDKSMRNLSGSVRSTLGVFATFLSGRAILGFAKSQIQVAAALENSAETLGLTTEQLGFYQHAAKRVGIETRTLNMLMQRFSRRVGEAALGGGELAGTLERLGIDAKKLSKMDIATQFEFALNVLSKIENQNEKIATQFKFFDSEGVAGGRMAGTLKAAREEFDKFSLVLRGPSAKVLEKMGTDAMALASAFKALGRDFLVDVSPQAIKAIETLGDILIAYRKVTGNERLGVAEREKRGTSGGITGALAAGGATARFARNVFTRTAKGVSGAIGQQMVRDEGGPRFNERLLEQQRQQLIGGRPEFAGSTGRTNMQGTFGDNSGQEVAQMFREEMKPLLQIIANNTATTGDDF